VAGCLASEHATHFAREYWRRIFLELADWLSTAFSTVGRSVERGAVGLG
jgi:hypothetical protein